MQSNHWEVNDRAHAVRQSQIMVYALIMGVVIFVSIAIVLVNIRGIAASDLSGVLIGLGGVFGAGALIASSLVPRFLRLPNVINEKGLIQAFLARNVIQKAFLEGACFLNTLTYIIEQNVFSLGIVAFLIAAMLTSFPTRTKLDHFIKTHSSTEIR